MKTHLTHVAGLLFAATAAQAESHATPVLTIYTYDSFVTDWGPGPLVEAGFEETCACDLEFVGHGDGAALLARLMLEGPRTEADIVLGLDTNLTAAAAETGMFTSHGVTAALDLPIAWDDQTFLPYDWGYFAFVGNAGEPAPANFEDLAASDVSIVIQDPRSSTPGLGLLLWIEAAYGERAPEIWEALADNIVTVTPGWSEAYGLFLEGEADAVLSYTTSPAYHLIAEEDDSKVAWAFDEGHYLQVEVAGILEGTDQPDLAAAFMAFMVSPGFQDVIATANWMYPAVTPEAGLPGGFETLITPDLALLMSSEDAAAARGPAIDAWQAALTQ
ncbi:thiamine ABC transporter substrate binding subunit [Flavimaricola marinus]|uniref:Thiamine-binding periplasmic protein n=1 Tax=Flavimaricola marinus TaxID=1819565 RepID=A0A238LIA7_9RHOB|nr:thiamine ABC transporter substrate binding subunit [Flavimaricola marinus]SMY09381.1 Thiamine-binding periplasmic protein precursor [Flavimaricola marinus]